MRNIYPVCGCLDKSAPECHQLHNVCDSIFIGVGMDKWFVNETLGIGHYQGKRLLWTDVANTGFDVEGL